MEEKTRLIQQLDQARDEMRAVLTGIGPRQEIYPGWTIKHVLAHITGWDEVSVAALHAHVAGDDPSPPMAQDIEQYNTEAVAARESLSYEDVVRECERVREQLKTLIMDMPPAKLAEPLLFPWGPTGTVAQLVNVFANHELEHAREIRDLVHKKT
ncbi:MAG TPA: DinB family protein [Chloroflexi bacterium]|nr:DinB family protein [Chloroflexota bacterium]